MAENEADILLFADDEGNYYLILPEMLEQARVTAEAKAEIDARLAADTSGFVTPIPIPKLAPVGQLALAQPQQFRLIGGLRAGSLGGIVSGMSGLLPGM